MEFIRNAPFLRILPAFCIGSILGSYDVFSAQVFYILLGAAFVALILLFRQKKFIQFRFSGYIFQLIFVAAGFLICKLNDDRRSRLHFTHSDAKIYYAVVTGEPELKSGRMRAVAEIRMVGCGDKFRDACGKSYIYYPASVILHCNDRIIFAMHPRAILPPLNPGAFDFRYYSSLSRIYYQVQLTGQSIIRAGRSESLASAAIGIRNKFLDSYKRAGVTGQEYAVLSALVLGFDDEIDRTVMSAFSASGTLHVLSVSGMHVGLIFAGLSFILSFMEKKKSLMIPRLCILICSLWFYALLTGLSPSVIRSAMMFTFILLGKTFGRSTSIYNSLAISALAIFVFFDPVLLFHPGLQLSYLAVAGIAYFYPKINSVYSGSNIIIEKICSLTAVSIAAQLATLPVSIFYFHQFPVYFIPANLLIIPLSTAAIFGGIFLLFVGEFSSLAYYT